MMAANAQSIAMFKESIDLCLTIAVNENTRTAPQTTSPALANVTSPGSKTEAGIRMRSNPWSPWNPLYSVHSEKVSPEARLLGGDAKNPNCARAGRYAVEGA